MKAPTEIVAYGSDRFSDWLSAYVDKSEKFSFNGGVANIEETIELVRSKKPRLLVVDFEAGAPSELVQIGLTAQRAFQWVSVLYVFPSPEDSSVRFARQIKNRKWSIAGRELMDRIGFDQLMAGVLTESGLVDLSLNDYETAQYEKTLEQAESVLNGDNEEDEDAA